MNKVELSIVVPIYNVERYLEECLNSIYQLRIDKEVILVNDDSPDNSEMIINKYKERFPDETIVIKQKNKGLSGARNTGLENAKGKYVAFVDSDDYVYTQEYEKFFKSNKDEDLDIIIGNYVKLEEGKIVQGRIVKSKINKLGIISGEKYLEECLKLNCFREEVWDDIYRKDFLIENNLLFKEKLLHEDTLFSIQALIKAKKIKFINEAVYIYRQRSGGIMSNLGIKSYQHRIYIVKELLKLEKQIYLNEYLVDILWKVFKEKKIVSLKMLQKCKIQSMKSLIKISIMFVMKFKCKNIEIIDI